MKKDSNIKSSYLSFKLNKEIFAIGVEQVIEVLEKQIITEVPNAPGYICGVINFRGDILAVTDLRKKLNLPECNEEQYVVIVLEIQTGNKKILSGAIADSVVDVISFSYDEIKDVPAMGSHFNTELIKGMIKISEKFITILNIEKVLDTDGIIISSDNNMA